MCGVCKNVWECGECMRMVNVWVWCVYEWVRMGWMYENGECMCVVCVRMSENVVNVWEWWMYGCGVCKNVWECGECMRAKD